MSLLLKALKQAEAAHASKPAADRASPDNRIEGTLELEPVIDADPEPEWVEPPGLLFSSTGPSPAAPRAAPAFRMPQLSLVPVVALLAVIVAVGYGIYLYFELQPPDSAQPLPQVSAPPTPATLPPLVAALPVAPPLLTPHPVPTQPAPAMAAPQPNLQPAAPVLSQPRPAPETLVRPAAITQAEPRARTTPGLAAPNNTSRTSAVQTAPPSAAAPVQFQPDVQSTLLSQAHAAYQRGTLAEAQRLYTQAATRNRSVDTLLGLAAIASVQNREIDAQRLYREVLDINPRNAAAQAALLDLLGNTDGPATESRLKTLIDRDPSPQLYQTLGNLYADQKRWSDAQAAYFEAYRYAPDNADYAFNLAVSLDQLRQSPAALRYYEKALATGGAHRFDRAQAEARVQQLKATQR